MASEVTIGIADHRAAAGEFVAAWKRAEQGEIPMGPVGHLHFADMATLLKTLTSTRWHLLELLHQVGPSTIRGLSKRLHRDYKNVHTDIGTLERLGLVARDERGRWVVPWSAIVSELKLGAPGSAATAA
ncbi:MAG: MarR family transcriptional regulator [Magnetococcales bacterium]|nr:MarR family transcriptional regulator [Magnetococcales bacterium]MBF0157374.1 MarR family transcriptional regulator [Magnetococcales bacterium]